MKILIGIIEIANNINEFTNALRKSGYHVDSIAIVNDFYGSDYTYSINLLNKKKKLKKLRIILERFLLILYFFKLVFKYDTFVFIFDLTFLPLRLDLILLRLLRKRVIYFNCGDDVRYRPIHYRIGQKTGQIDFMNNISNENKKNYYKRGNSFLSSFYLQRIEEITDCTIVSMRNQATFSSTYFHSFKFPTKPGISGKKKANRIPKIIHAPSDPVVKRTDIVLRAIEILREEKIDFDFELIQGKSNDYVLEALSMADIVVDQCSDWIAKFACEGMAAGCAVIGGNNYQYENFQNNSPVIQFIADENVLANTLRTLILDIDYRQSLMDKSYIFWKQYYSQGAFELFFSSLLDKTASKVYPFPGYKRMLLQESENWFQRAIIQVFYPNSSK